VLGSDSRPREEEKMTREDLDSASANEPMTTPEPMDGARGLATGAAAGLALWALVALVVVSLRVF
jgi:hypothetical protein